MDDKTKVVLKSSIVMALRAALKSLELILFNQKHWKVEISEENIPDSGIRVLMKFFLTEDGNASADCRCELSGSGDSWTVNRIDIIVRCDDVSASYEVLVRKDIFTL